MAFLKALLIGKARQYGSVAATDELGKAWRSAIFKNAQTGEIYAGELGFEGDEVAYTKHHGGVNKAVFANSLENYPAWEAYLGLKKAMEEKNIDYILANLSNDLETTTFSLYPKVELTKRDLLNRGIRHVLMSGSGPTVFSLFKTSEEAMYWFKVLQKDYPHILLTTTLVAEDLDDRVLKCDD